MTGTSGFPVLRSQKQTLPPGWEERISKKHPDKPFFFNKKTKERRWTNPLESTSKMVTIEQKSQGDKRKIENSNEARSDTISPFIDKTPNSPRLLLKARRQKQSTQDNIGTHASVDTPMMRQIREKKAQREFEAQKKLANKNQTTKKELQSENQIITEDSSQIASAPRRKTRRSSIASSTGSERSINSNASSLGSKIQIAASIPEKVIENKELSQISIKNLPKIPKVQPCSVPLVTASAPQNYHQKNLAEKRLQRIRQSLDLGKDNSINNTASKDLTPRKSIGSCPANERLKRLRQNLNSEENTPEKKIKKLASDEKSATSPLIKSKLLNSPLPNLFEEAPTRIHSLDNRVQKGGMLEVLKKKPIKLDEEENKRDIHVLEKIESTGSFSEEMDWEPIEDEKITFEVQSVRSQLCKNSTEIPNDFPCNNLQTPPEENSALYIVIDTNVYLSNLSFVEEVRDSHSDVFGRPYIVVPWTVLQELDYMKDDKNNTRSEALKQKARKAVNFLNNHFKNKHPRFLGQTPSEVEKNKDKFITECPDDEILQTCLQIKEASKTPVLLSYDKNLCNKALFFDVATIGRNDPLEKIYYLKAAETTNFMSNSLDISIHENPYEMPLSRKELILAEDIMEKGKKVLKDFLSEVVVQEMKYIFEKEWELRLIIKPPWTKLEDVLICARKHWMAAVSEGFERKTEKMLEKIKDFLKENDKSIIKLENVKFFLEQCNDIAQTLNESKYSDLKNKAINELFTLSQCCLDTNKAIGNARLREAVGSVKNDSEEERRSSLAFKVLENIYAFARDACGIAASGVGLPCSFSFNKDHSGITVEYARQHYKEIGASVNKLLDVLRTILKKIDEDLYANDKTILALHEALVTFSSDLNFDELIKMAPLDVLCCVKRKKPELEKGYEQLQELLIHFCQLANFQCK